MTAELQLLTGTRLVGPLTTLVALIANASAVWQLSQAPNQIGVKTFKLKKVTGRNLGGGNQWLHIGTGVGGTFLDAIPPLFILNNMDFEFGEAELGNVEFTADMTAYPDVNTVMCQVEVEEIG